MARLSLAEAFSLYGAKPANRISSQSALANDGALVLRCAQAGFKHERPGVLRYEDRLVREDGRVQGAALLGEHLLRARDEALPVRMIVASAASPTGSKTTVSFHVRPDLVGKVTEFDGDHFIVDFIRSLQVQAAAKQRI